jgi:uncharacterized membrane protein
MADSPALHFQNAWKAFKSYPRVFVISMLALFATWVALEVAVVALQRFGVVVWLILHLAFFVFFSGLMLGLHRMALETMDGQAPKLASLPALLGRSPTFLFAFCVYSVVVMVGLVLLVVPGIYVAAKYALFGQALATKSTTASQALRNAAALSAGHVTTVFAVLLIAFLLNLAGAAFLGVGLLLTFPVSLLATSDLYRSLQRSTL